MNLAMHSRAISWKALLDLPQPVLLVDRDSDRAEYNERFSRLIAPAASACLSDISQVLPFLPGCAECAFRGIAGEVHQGPFTIRYAPAGDGVAMILFDTAREVDSGDLSFLADNIDHILWMADAQGVVCWSNRRWLEFAGDSSVTWKDRIVQHHRERVLDHFSQCIANQIVWEDTFPMIAKQGNTEWFLGRAVPVADGKTGTIRWVGTNTQISEQKRMEQALRRANDELQQMNHDLEQFAFSASHDLQEPMRNISVYSEIIQRRYVHAFDDRGRQLLVILAEAAQRMEMLLKDLLAYTELTHDHSPPESVDSERALQCALQCLDGTIRQSGAEVNFRHLPSVRMPRGQLEQLFLNLIGNALKYRKDEQAPRILVECRREGPFWLFRVADNGIGIEPQYQERIFGLFKRLHTRTKYPGTGIGLALCQRIIERSGGSIWLRSAGLGQGSTFYFTIPAQEEEPDTAGTGAIPLCRA